MTLDIDPLSQGFASLDGMSHDHDRRDKVAQPWQQEVHIPLNQIGDTKR